MNWIAFQDGFTSYLSNVGVPGNLHPTVYKFAMRNIPGVGNTQTALNHPNQSLGVTAKDGDEKRQRDLRPSRNPGMLPTQTIKGLQTPQTPQVPSLGPNTLDSFLGINTPYQTPRSYSKPQTTNQAGYAP